MSNSRQIVENFFAAVASGDVPDELLTDDMTVWTTTTPNADKQSFQQAIKILKSIVSGSIDYQLVSVTAEDDRIVAEISSTGLLINGDRLANQHLVLFHIRDGRIAVMKEHMNPNVVKEKIAPLMQEMMQKNRQ